MAQEFIELRGARENNLKDVSLTIPKRKITIFTGVSGSGKSPPLFQVFRFSGRLGTCAVGKSFDLPEMKNYIPQVKRLAIGLF